MNLDSKIAMGIDISETSIDLALLKIEYASYTEELGAYAGQRPDKRQTVQISLGWY